MLRVDRICVYIIMLGMVFIIPGIKFITYLDEFCAMLFGGIAVLDCIVNGNWRKYKLLWIIMSIITLYAVYSLTMVRFNVPRAIFLDWVISVKPFIPFIVMFAIAPKFTQADKKIIKVICLLNAAVLSAAFLCGHNVVQAVVFHVTYGGTTIFMSMMLYLYCSIGSDRQISKRALTIAIVFLTFGLLCTRAKYFGIYVLSLYFLYAYRPGVLRHLTLTRLIGLLMIAGLVIAVSWHKIEYYFLTGNSGTFDPTVAESFARPVLYATSFLIFLDFFPFGSGLASFATHASEHYYSDLYFYYGIDKVWGLSPSYPNFICDAYYPSLAQFGIIGLILFMFFWRYCYKFLRIFIRQNATKYRFSFVIGSLIICFIMIECTSGNTFTQIVGTFAMALLGMLCAQGRELYESQSNSECDATQEKLQIRKI